MWEEGGVGWDGEGVRVIRCRQLLTEAGMPDVDSHQQNAVLVVLRGRCTPVERLPTLIVTNKTQCW